YSFRTFEAKRRKIVYILHFTNLSVFLHFCKVGKREKKKERFFISYLLPLLLLLLPKSISSALGFIIEEEARNERHELHFITIIIAQV
ncbi:MAG: hypothetical protein ACRD5B_11670, partial [Nitrososphaeraceae archaeon]